MFKNNMKFTRAASCINSKVSSGDNSTTLIFWCYHYCWSLLYCNCWKSLMLRTSHLLNPDLLRCNLLLIHSILFFKNNRNMAANSVEKHCCVVLNVKLLNNLRSKCFIDFGNCYPMLSPWSMRPIHGLLCSEVLHVLAVST